MTNMDMSNRRTSMIRQGSSTFVTTAAGVGVGGAGGARKSSYLKSNNDYAKKESADRRDMLKQKLSFLDTLGDLSEEDDDMMTNFLNKKTTKTATATKENDSLSVSVHGTSSLSTKSKSTVGGSKLRFPRRHKSLGHQVVSASRQERQEEQQQHQHNETPVVLATPSQTPPPQTQQQQHHTKALRRNSSYGVLNGLLDKDHTDNHAAADASDSCSVTVDNSVVATASGTKTKKKKARRRSSLGGLFGKGRGSTKDDTDKVQNDSSHDHSSHNPYGYEDTSASHNDDVTVNQKEQQEPRQPVKRRSSLGFLTGRGKTDKKNQDHNDSSHHDHSHSHNPYGYEDMSTSHNEEAGDSHQPQQAESHKPVRRRLSIGALAARGKKSRDKNSNSDDASVATTSTKTSKKAKKADKKKAKKEKKEQKKKEKNDSSSKVSKKGKAQRRFSGMFSGMADHNANNAVSIKNGSDNDSDEYTMTTEPSSNASLSPTQQAPTDGDYLRKAKERQEQLRRDQQKKQDDLGGSRHRRRFSLTGRRTSIGGNGAPAASSSGAALATPGQQQTAPLTKPQDDSGFYNSDDDDDDDDSDDDAVSVSQVGANVLSYGMKFLEGLYDEVS
eukprot:CAMPEP_0113482014 /NCGR_PEP_ID=MMETSP0014_2-20120614/22703_1 /TAXON_ID=2857 /ORGANISM="Nitzschia sp." /LENGTH=611 /DNA_ID=CAMNT_0000375523 /DNA_START=131 /DNA_END=1966 /DNA_ORIENTATION=- /assembly_acc=CAM_ASM_000159